MTTLPASAATGLPGRHARSVRAARNVQLICVWCGVALLAAVGIAIVLLAGFVPGPTPSLTAAQITSQYVHNLGGIRAGMCIEMAGVALLAPWGAAVAMQTHRANPRSGVLTATQIMCVAAATIIGIMAPLVWGLAAFRAGSISPETTRTLNDLGWFLFIFDWSPFALWYAAVGLAIITDPGDEPVFPRWAGYLSFWTAGLSAPGGLTILFKTGPLAYNGLLALWVPLTVFGIWIVVMTVLVIRAIHSEAADAHSLSAPP